ncbi:methylated-DNA--[protein]-cysteine S-methyltransferase [Terrihabitans sp. B22-R8]|uniref:methylated-DNA--[protein]-cysteine S-methyltransferase n=1 Tax=Terrihabitans sp. B22-R8 TaxID=3425128 RepID=UPI00403CE981
MLKTVNSEAGRGENRPDIVFGLGECSLGQLLVARSEAGICAILLGDDSEALVADVTTRLPGAGPAADRSMDDVVREVADFIDAPSGAFGVSVDARGTPFQKNVWRALLDIPAGQTVSYAELARRIGQPAAVRAVARACGANPVAVAIPCHRVVRSDGGASGYRWGVDRKRALLAREAQAAS